MLHIPNVSPRAIVAAVGVACAALVCTHTAQAAPAAAASAPKATAAKKAPVHPTSKAKAKGKPAPAPVVEAPLPPAPQEQLDAAERVYYGHYDCEFKQTVDIASDPKNVGYVEVKHLKSAWIMKPVLSSTGAVRLEDVKGGTLMVQIAQKSMLMDVKAGHRLVDECISPKQRELMEAAKAKAAEDEKAAAAAAAASAAPAAGAVKGE